MSRTPQLPSPETLLVIEYVRKRLAKAKKAGKHPEAVAEIGRALGVKRPSSVVSKLSCGHTKSIKPHRIPALLKVLGLTEAQFQSELCDRRYAIRIAHGLPDMAGPLQYENWPGVEIVRPTRRLLAQRLTAYQVIIQPKHESGDQSHVDFQPDDGLPGDEAIILACGAVRVHVDGEEPITLTRPGDTVLLKTHMVHRAEWVPATNGSKNVTTTPTIITVIRYPLPTAT